MHTINQEWVENANRFRKDILEHVLHPNSSNVTVGVTPAVRGGWKVGYTHSGKFRVTFSYATGFTYPTMKTFKPVYLPPEIGKARTAWDKLKGRVEHIAQENRILALYRGSGLIPKRVAKAHTKRVKAIFPDARRWMDEPEALKMVSTLSAKYIARYGKCPKCTAVGKWQETILGWSCEECGATWEDFDYANCKWAEKAK